MTPELIGFIFAIPALMGLGEHWYLSDSEEKEVSAATWTAIGALPKSKRKNIEKWVTQYFPFIMFALVTGTIVGKRIAQTIELSKSKRPAKVIHMGDRSNVETDGFNAGEETADRTSSGGTKGYISDPISEAFGANSGIRN